METELSVQEQHSRQNLQDRGPERRELNRELRKSVDSPECSAKHSSVHECEETIQGWGKNYQRFEDRCQVLTHGWGQCLFPPDRWEKIVIYRTLSTVLGKVLLQ